MLLSAYRLCYSHCVSSQGEWICPCVWNGLCAVFDCFLMIVSFPQDDRYFLSGSLDGKLRLWNIPDKKVALWNEVDGQTRLITAANFCQNGKYAVIGTYDGRCIFYDTEVCVCSVDMLVLFFTQKRKFCHLFTLMSYWSCNPVKHYECTTVVYMTCLFHLEMFLQRRKKANIFINQSMNSW